MMGKELQPVVGALCPLSATSDADRLMDARGVFGKIVLGDFMGDAGYAGSSWIRGTRELHRDKPKD